MDEEEEEEVGVMLGFLLWTFVGIVLGLEDRVDDGNDDGDGAVEVEVEEVGFADGLATLLLLLLLLPLPEEIAEGVEFEFGLTGGLGKGYGEEGMGFEAFEEAEPETIVPPAVTVALTLGVAVPEVSALLVGMSAL